MSDQVPQSADSASSNSDDTLKRLSTLLGFVVAPATGVTSLLYYFGWKRTQYFWQEFGINERLLGYNTQDFLLRSVDALFYPVAFVLLMTLALRSLHRRVTARIVDSCWSRTTEWVLMALGTALTLLTLVGPWWNVVDESAVITPVGCAVGVLLLAYSGSIRGMRPAPTHGSPHRTAMVSLVLVALLLFIASFWSVDNWARVVGRSRARGVVAQQLSGLPEASVYSRDRLHMGGEGVQETRLQEEQGGYRFRYSGLRLLGYSNKKFFLLSKDSYKTVGRAFVLADDATVRVDFIPPNVRRDRQ